MPAPAKLWAWSLAVADRLVTVAQFADYIEAEMAKQLLADHGIEAVATCTNASALYSLGNIERPKLQVLESQAERAREILESTARQEE